MSLTLNAIDALLQATSPRLLAPVNARITIKNTTPIFHQNISSTFDPVSINFEAVLDYMEGTVTWSSSGCTLTSISGNTAVLLPANMPGGVATVTASLTYRGTPFTTSVAISKVIDGVGPAGDRGAGKFYASGSSWSDAVADAATPGANVVDDVVNISNGTSFVNEKRWNGSAWVAMGAVYDGTLLVTGTVTAGKLATNAVTAGTIAVGAVAANNISVTNLSSIQAELGSAVISTTGYLRSGQSAYATGAGWWLGYDSGTPKFSIGDGTYYFRWTGSTIEYKLPQISLGTLSNVSSPSGSNGARIYGTRTLTPSGGTAPYKYNWYLVSPDGVYLSGGIDTATVEVSGSATNDGTSAYLYCLVIDANGLSATINCTVTAVHGTPP